MNKKEGMLRAPADLRPLKIRSAHPSASAQLWQVDRNPLALLCDYAAAKNITRATAPAEPRMWLLGPQRRGGASLSERGGGGLVGGVPADTIETWLGRARFREREAGQSHGQRYFRSPHFRLRCSRCWCRRPGREAAGLCLRRLVSARL